MLIGRLPLARLAVSVMEPQFAAETHEIACNPSFVSAFAVFPQTSQYVPHLA
jgi:hypothetical protein